MDPSCTQHCLTDTEREAFERDGFLLVPDALSPTELDRLTALVDDLGQRRASEVEPGGRLHLRDFLHDDPMFMDLLDWPTTFPKIWGILGWHIQLYLSHVDITAPWKKEQPLPKRLGWHQDSGRVNQEMEGDPRPRLSVKVGYFLSDVSVPGRGNFCVVPGSHHRNRLEGPEDADPTDAMPVCVAPGTAVLFDRRLWHAPSPNTSTVTRKAVFYGYSYRWLRPRDNLRIEDYPDCHDPIRRQLLGASRDGHGYSSPEPGDVPLKAWLEEHAAGTAA